MELDRSLLLTLPLLMFGCGNEPPAPAPAPAEPPKAAAPPADKATPKPEKPALAAKKSARKKEPLNVLLLTIDALRADMPWSGYARDIAPNLTRFARENVVFDNHRSVTSFTAQSVPAMLSGRYASTLYRSGYFFAGYQDSNELFPEALQQKGIRTMAVHSHLYFNRGKGLNQGFDLWEMVPRQISVVSAPPTQDVRRLSYCRHLNTSGFRAFEDNCGSLAVCSIAPHP